MINEKNKNIPQGLDIYKTEDPEHQPPLQANKSKIISLYEKPRAIHS